MKRFSASLVLLLGISAGLLALTPAPRAEAPVKTDFTPRQQKQIEALIRQYILTHPEIIPEAIAELQRREAAKILANYRRDIETPFPGAETGNPNGDVTLVEFFDFRCPYCRKAHQDIARLVAEDPNLRVVFREFPVLDREGDDLSRQAATAALAAAKQGRYYTFHSQLFSSPGRLTRETLVAAVRKAGLDENRLVTDMSAKDVEQEISNNLELGRNLGLSGTPTYIIGDRVISGAVDYEELKKAIAEARSRASK